MGQLFSCSQCCKDGKYETVEDSNFKNDPGSDFFKEFLSEFDSKASIFEGLVIEQKFTSKQSYEPRFMWVNLESRTIHMSTHNTKDRRHKEASLQDVTSVEPGAPKRAKKSEDPNISACCLTVNFQRGGGIDLRFASEKECDLWFRALTKIVAHLKRSASMVSP
jgi:hypothetical protein